MKLGVHKESGKEFAIKYLMSERLKSVNLAEYFKDEIETLKELVHPNIIRLKEAYPEGTLVKDDGSNEQVMYIVLELAEQGDLFDYIAKIAACDERTTLHYFKQLIEALEYMHNEGVCHRDLKLQNFMLNNEYELKLADFGFSISLAGRDGSGDLYTHKGTPG